MRHAIAVVVVVGLFVGLSGCRGCIAQHDPRGDWKLFTRESDQANKPQPILTEDGKIPPTVAEVDPNAAAQDPTDQKYSQLCSSCHGAEGKGDGAAASALNPKPRNFATWKDDVTDEYIAKIIREGGTAVGKSASMAAWGGILSEDEITAMVGKIKKFRQQ